MIFNFALTIALFGLVEVAFYDATVKFVSSQIVRIMCIVVASYGIQWAIATVLAALGLPNDAVKFSTSIKINWDRFGARRNGTLQRETSGALSYSLFLAWLALTTVIAVSLFTKFGTAFINTTLSPPEQHFTFPVVLAIWSVLMVWVFYRWNMITSSLMCLGMLGIVLYMGLVVIELYVSGGGLSAFLTSLEQVRSFSLYQRIVLLIPIACVLTVFLGKQVHEILRSW